MRGALCTSSPQLYSAARNNNVHLHPRLAWQPGKANSLAAVTQAEAHLFDVDVASASAKVLFLASFLPPLLCRRRLTRPMTCLAALAAYEHVGPSQ